MQRVRPYLVRVPKPWARNSIFQPPLVQRQRWYSLSFAGSPPTLCQSGWDTMIECFDHAIAVVYLSVPTRSPNLSGRANTTARVHMSRPRRFMCMWRHTNTPRRTERHTGQQQRMTGCDTIPSLSALRTPPPHALSLRLSTLSIDAPKRKQPATADPKRHGHHGLGADSGEPLSRVVLSRLVQQRPVSPRIGVLST